MPVTKSPLQAGFEQVFANLPGPMGMIAKKLNLGLILGNTPPEQLHAGVKGMVVVLNKLLEEDNAHGIGLQNSSEASTEQ